MYSTGRRAREKLSQPITVNALGVSGARHKDCLKNSELITLTILTLRLL